MKQIILAVTLLSLGACSSQWAAENIGPGPQRYAAQCANIGITEAHPSFVQCVAWREQVDLQKSAQFTGGLMGAAVMYSAFQPPPPIEVRVIR